jgi:hypothetical protein
MAAGGACAGRCGGGRCWHIPIKKRLRKKLHRLGLGRKRDMSPRRRISKNCAMSTVVDLQTRPLSANFGQHGARRNAYAAEQVTKPILKHSQTSEAAPQTDEAC